MKKSYDKLIYLGATLLVAILMSVYADGQSTKTTRNSTESGATTTGILKGLVSSKSEKVSVPLQLNGIDTDEYYISGAPDTVDVTLTGSSALVTAAKNTKNFQVYADLTKLTDGTHTVALKVSGLNRDLTYKLAKAKVTVTIYKRTSAYYTVHTDYNKDAIADGYTVGTVTSSVNNVQLMGRESAVNEVQTVVAVAQLKRDTSKSVTQTVTLQALDAKGHPVDVGISPQVTTVKIPVTAGTGTKQVPLKIKTKNGPASNFNLTGSVNEITVRGKIDVLNKLKEIPVTVDLNGVTAASSQDVTVNTPDGTDSVNPTTVTVTITPKEQ
ncbi:hypothetical protein FO439_03360 [Weissella cibaria]|uniref:CdaR family protein n=1 Tax=Weissella cibaria TaxID=137591 RepID=UPI0007A59BF8|nr:CdaR family protein [Weissella cibaria]QDG81698.1 hypothetical protein Wei3612_10220 [Weissella cibaria]TVV35705.1 hypothetical protein FO439_03360 [Weissella cibaria]UNW40456.1 hypothetical protein HUW87_09520 [Weissella cibaria]